MTTSRWAALAALLLGLAVVLGAFGAHGLKDLLDPYSLSVYEKAVFYHFVHALGLLLVAVLAQLELLSTSSLQRTGFLLAGGTIVFSGSLYLLAVTGLKWLGAVTPIGGTAFIVAWFWLACSLWRDGSKTRP